MARLAQQQLSDGMKKTLVGRRLTSQACRVEGCRLSRPNMAWYRCMCGRNRLLMQADMLQLEGLQSSKQSQLALFQQEKARLEEDVDVPLRLKQGQVEVEPQGLVDSSLDHAVLVSQQVAQVSFLWSPPLHSPHPPPPPHPPSLCYQSPSPHPPHLLVPLPLPAFLAISPLHTILTYPYLPLAHHPPSIPY